MCPRVNATDRAAVAEIAGDFRPFPIGVHGGVPCENATAHLAQQTFHPVEQPVEFVCLEQIAVTPVRFAVVRQRIIELAAVACGRIAVELPQSIQPESPGVTVGQPSGLADAIENGVPAGARLVIAAQAYVKNSSGISRLTPNTGCGSVRRRNAAK